MRLFSSRFATARIKPRQHQPAINQNNNEISPPHLFCCMMSDEEFKMDEPAAEAPEAVPRTPSASVYTIDVENPLTARNVPYFTPVLADNVTLVRSRGSMGVVLAASDSLEWTDVYGNEEGSVLPFNEPTNRMGLKLASMIIDVMKDYRATGSTAKKRKKGAVPTTPDGQQAPSTPSNLTGGKVSEAGPCSEVYKSVAEYLANQNEIDKPDITEREHSYAFYVMKHFSVPRKGNYALDQVLLTYAKIRLGQYSSEWYQPEGFRRLDELKAALFAIQMCLMEFLKSRGEKPKVVGSPNWTLPIVHMLNDHMTFHKLEPLVFHELGTIEDLLGPIRATHCKSIYSKGHEILVENRPHVIEQLKKFAHDVMEVTLDDPPQDEGPPAEGNQGTPTKPRSRRRLF